MPVSHIDDDIMVKVTRKAKSNKLAKEIVGLRSNHKLLVEHFIAHLEYTRQNYPWGSLSK
jgi:hypothetical protein